MKCTSDPDHSADAIEYVVKYRQGKAGAAALISEVICAHLLASGGIRCLPRVLVEASAAFSTASAHTDIGYTIEQGLHFGTELDSDVVNGPPELLEYVATPQELVDIWVFDTWLCNVDRERLGNTLLKPRGRRLSYDIIACDQSDCFCGAGVFSARNWRGTFLARKLASAPLFPDFIARAGPLTCVDAAIQKVRGALRAIDSAVACVPTEWWYHSEVNRDEVVAALRERADGLAQILNPTQWQGFDEIIKGAHVLR